MTVVEPLMTNLFTRTLNWPACYNVRDLGGLPTGDGHITQWRAIVRSDIPARLTAEGRAALVDYGIRTIIDLREPDQVGTEPSIFMARSDDPATPTYLNLPMKTREPAIGALISAAKDRAAVYQIILDHYPLLIARIMRVVGSASDGGILIHCHAGKDRTGIIVALLLGLVGVPQDVIAADYAESQVCLWPLWEEIVAKVGGEANADFWLKPTATAEMMHNLLTHLENRYGGVARYLLAIGLTDEELTQVRSRLLGRLLMQTTKEPCYS